MMLLLLVLAHAWTIFMVWTWLVMSIDLTLVWITSQVQSLATNDPNPALKSMTYSKTPMRWTLFWFSLFGFGFTGYVLIRYLQVFTMEL